MIADNGPIAVRQAGQADQPADQTDCQYWIHKTTFVSVSVLDDTIKYRFHFFKENLTADVKLAHSLL